MQGATKGEQVFQPGDLVPESGIYTVVHDHHRQRHTATIFKGRKFPACARCGDKVRFMLSQPATLVNEDVDFNQPAPHDGAGGSSDT